jgi:hypothetical protein
VLLIQDQQPVEILRPNGPHKPLGHPVRLWSAKRRSDSACIPLYGLGGCPVR